LEYIHLYSPGWNQSRNWLAVCGTYALVVSVINTYRSLWTVLLKLRLRHNSTGAGRLLLRISLSLMYTITAIVTLFALAYALVSYLSGPSGPNMIMEHIYQLRRLDYLDFHSYFYFSSVTYFSLGYGDFLPRGQVMIGLIYLESLLGYINSGILIAYAFNLFTKLDR
ncbi:MAG TPA: ion channel, partial [Bacillota bacterium]|nr:ion channel [Bacillota bacterium]